MKLVIDIPNFIYQQIIKKHISKATIAKIFENGTPLPNTNGDVLMTIFPPSVYYGDEEKHIVLLTKDVELNCLNTDWWNAEYQRGE